MALACWYLGTKHHMKIIEEITDNSIGDKSIEFSVDEDDGLSGIVLLEIRRQDLISFMSLYFQRISSWDRSCQRHDTRLTLHSDMASRNENTWSSRSS